MTTKREIIELLKRNDKAVARALVVLYHRQTLDERSTEATLHHNGVGFTGSDAAVGTSMAKFFLARGYLTPKQLAYWRKPNVRGTLRICKYAGQLLDAAKEKAEKKMLTLL